MKELIRMYIKNKFYFWLWSDSFFDEFYSANCIWIEHDFIWNDYCKMILCAKYHRFMCDYIREVISCHE